MKIQELRELNEDEQSQKLAALKKELFGLRMQQTDGKLSQPHKVREARRGVAQLLTLRAEASGGASASASHRAEASGGASASASHRARARAGAKEKS